MNGKTYLHIHGAIADMKNQVLGGHINRAIVGATCEMVIDCIDGQVDRAFSDEIGLNLLVL